MVFEKNYVYNIRGPFPRGQMIQTNGLKGGSGSSRITCNVSDACPASAMASRTTCTTSRTTSTCTKRWARPPLA